jgi:hypothetical protein
MPPSAAMGYANPYHYRGRPSILTAVGILSIVFGGIGAFYNLISGFASLGFLGLALNGGMPVPVRPPTTPVPAPVAVTPSGVPGQQPAVTGGVLVDADEDGLAAGPRVIVVSGLSRVRPLSDAKRRQLDALLTQAGLKIFPFAGKGTTPQTVRANVTESGTLPSAAGGTGPTYYIVGTGRIEVYDDHALFRPDGSADVVSVFAPTPSQMLMPTTGGGGTGAGSNAGTFNSRVTITPRGSRTAGGPIMTTRTVSISTRAIATSLVESALSLLLSVFLVIAGILVLRDSSNARPLHWIYVWIKIPLTIAGGIAAWLMWQSVYGAMISGMPRAPGTAPPPRWAMSIFWVVAAGLGLSYPVALIFVLTSRNVKAYYSPARD